jgi:hypothetical protein
MNSIIAIHPYMTEGIWVFDDPKVGLVQEPFVSGTDTSIERMSAGITHAQNGFTLLFSVGAFPGYQLELSWVRADMSGNWYRSEALGMEGWLCPALLKYFEAPPQKLFAQFRAKSTKRLSRRGETGGLLLASSRRTAYC